MVDYPFCENCCYRINMEMGSYDWIECHRYPPVFVPNEEDGSCARWPEVEHNDWCGEWEAGSGRSI
jgi:hypothetical protein